MNRGQIIELEIEDMTVDGQSLGKTPEGLAVFVYGALPGDTVIAELTKLKKRYALAKLVDIVTPSPQRTGGFCDFQQECGGCMYSKLTYGMQAALKEKHVREALIRLAGIKNPVVRPIMEDQRPFRYRNKANMPVAMQVQDNPKVGFYRRKSHEIVNCTDCKIQSIPAVAVADALRRYMSLHKTHRRAQDAQIEEIRNLTVRTAFGTGEVMVILTLAGSGVPHAEELTEMLADAVDSCNQAAPGAMRRETSHDLGKSSSIAVDKCGESSHPEVVYRLQSIILDIATAGGGKNACKCGEGIFHKTGNEQGKKTKSVVLAGKNTIEDRLGSMKFEISPFSFYQVNPGQTEKLYDTVCRYAALKGGEKILDLYCGAGTIGLWLLNDLKQRDESAFEKTSVVGVESVKSAVLDANRNSVLNGIVNARYVHGKAEISLPHLISENFAEDPALKMTHVDVAILDPPRSGCNERLLSCLLKASPQKIIYVSCDPATLARDLKFILREGYEFVEATPVDMFCWTGHVEVLTLLTRKVSSFE